ncbi:hypothetical protein Enr10x_55760 [Gimesia panareensis]|uniref:Uncharacterized protein n=1 Tax=Gimesia panareensis TaxID=2527978 RepID=A0A517QEZ4_9PLAN|nr:hypothetical protein Enr10x_55760 [Gimesia panareensis]
MDLTEDANGQNPCNTKKAFYNNHGRIEVCLTNFYEDKIEVHVETDRRQGSAEVSKDINGKFPIVIVEINQRYKTLDPEEFKQALITQREGHFADTDKVLRKSVKPKVWKHISEILDIASKNHEETDRFSAASKITELVFLNFIGETSIGTRNGRMPTVDVIDRVAPSNQRTIDSWVQDFEDRKVNIVWDGKVYSRPLNRWIFFCVVSSLLKDKEFREFLITFREAIREAISSGNLFEKIPGLWSNDKLYKQGELAGRILKDSIRNATKGFDDILIGAYKDFLNGKYNERTTWSEIELSIQKSILKSMEEE